MNDFQNDVQRAWSMFFASPESENFYRSAKNIRLVVSELRAGRHPYSMESIVKVVEILKEALDRDPAKIPSGTAPKASAPVNPEPAPVREEDEVDYPKRGGIESGWAYARRVSAWREQRAKREWKKREGARLAAMPHHPDTIRNTSNEIRQRRLEQEQFALRKSKQS